MNAARRDDPTAETDRTGPDPTRIRAMFAKVAPGYDRANDVLSVRIHHRWRRTLVRMSGAAAGQRVLDCASGTGDLAIAFAHAVGPDGAVVATDFCREMLEPTPGKAARAGVAVPCSVADVTALPFGDDHFDHASIAFGIRNVADVPGALAEMARVTRPGGSVLVLEFGQMRTPVLRGAYRCYARHVLPRLGGWLTGQPGAYRYLESSSAAFPCGDAFARIFAAVPGITDVDVRPRMGGIAYVYRGVVG